MNRTMFLATLAVLTVLVVGSSLPNRFYRGQEQIFFLATAATMVLGVAGLVLFFNIRTLS
jgi:hypothetical protein